MANRRSLLKADGAAALVGALPVRAQKRTFAPRPRVWREFGMTTRIEVEQPRGVSRACLLPGSDGLKLGFRMYPQRENAAGRYDALDRDSFRSTITAREIAA